MPRRTALFAAVPVIVVSMILAGAQTGRNEHLPEDLDEYEHINAIVVPDEQSPVAGFHHFYINEKGLKTFRSKGPRRQYPAGTVIVGRVYRVQKTEDGAFKEGDLAAYTLMRKAPDAPETQKTGGWLFVKLNPEGERLEIDPVTDCFDCHKPHAETDFVISEPLEGERGARAP